MLLPLLEGLAVERIVILLAIYFHRLSLYKTYVLLIGYYKNNCKSRIKHHIMHGTYVYPQNIVRYVESVDNFFRQVTWIFISTGFRERGGGVTVDSIDIRSVIRQSLRCGNYGVYTKFCKCLMKKKSVWQGKRCKKGGTSMTKDAREIKLIAVNRRILWHLFLLRWRRTCY